MVNNIKYFFRSTPDDYVFHTGGIEHWLIIAIILLGIEFIVRYKNKLRIPKNARIFKISMIVMLTIQQIILYLWYEISGYFTIHESLPLYNCRVAIIFTILAFITNKDFYKNICCYWGVVGAILALAFPVLDPFEFPHYTQISFFIGHTLLLWSAVYFLAVEGHKINKISLNSVLIFTNIYHAIILIFNILTSSNYCYLNSPPFSIGFIDKISQLIYTCMAFTVFNISMVLFYLACKTVYMFFSKKKDTKYV